MKHSNRLEIDFAVPISQKKAPGFESIVAFSFYDGPENGLVVYSNGTGVRFSSLGESNSGLFRAFNFQVLEGDWKSRVDFILDQDSSEYSPVRVFIPSEPSELLDKLEKSVLEAIVKSQYLGVGSPYLEWAAAFLASDKLVKQASKEGFSFVHKMLKSQKQI